MGKNTILGTVEDKLHLAVLAAFAWLTVRGFLNLFPDFTPFNQIVFGIVGGTAVAILWSPIKKIILGK